MSPILYLSFLLFSAHASNNCHPFETSFSSLDQFTPVSPPHSYSTSERGLELYLRKPDGPVNTHNGVNDKIAQGATINSTRGFRYGRASFQLSAPRLAGAITAVIMICVDECGDELDIELLGGDPDHWQTNMYAPVNAHDSPQYDRFSSIENVDDIQDLHTYTIDWNDERIEWMLDGTLVRTLNKEDTFREGRYTYPTHHMRLQLGIWDGSGQSGTAHWAKGPVQWENQPDKVAAVLRSVKLECSE